MLQNYNNVLLLNDKIKDLKMDHLPDNLLLNQNDTYILKLVQTQFDMTYCILSANVTAYIPLKDQIYTKIRIDWGQNNGFTDMYTYNQTSTLGYVSHIYTNPGMYNILIDGDFKGLVGSEDESSTVITSNYLYYGNLSTNVVISTSSYTTNALQYYLYSINSWGTVPFDNLKNFCRNAFGLYSIPNIQLPNVNDCSNMFLNCINLKNSFNNQTKSMQNFALPTNVVNCQNMFKNTNIYYDFSQLVFPNYLTTISGMFDGTQIINLNQSFYINYVNYVKNNILNPQTSGNANFLSSYYYKCLPSSFLASNLIQDAYNIIGYDSTTSAYVRILTGQQIDIDSI